MGAVLEKSFREKSGADMDAHEKTWRECEIRADRVMRDILDEITSLHITNKEGCRHLSCRILRLLGLRCRIVTLKHLSVLCQRALANLKIKDGFDLEGEYSDWGILLDTEKVPVVDLTDN